MPYRWKGVSAIEQNRRLDFIRFKFITTFLIIIQQLISRLPAATNELQMI
jgi:hypothetical protein